MEESLGRSLTEAMEGLQQIQEAVIREARNDTDLDQGRGEKPNMTDISEE